MVLTEEIKKQRKYAKINLISRANARYGICEVLRMIYDEVEPLDNNEKITELLIDAMVMAKKMSDRLIYYKTTYNDTTGHAGKNLQRIYGVGDRNKVRRKRQL